MKKRLLYLLIALASPLLWGQSQVVCTTSSPGTVIGSCASGFSSPVTTDPVSATGVWTFDNAANTPVTCSDGVTDSTLTAGRVTFAGASGRLSDDADLTFATDTLSATKVSVNAGAGSGALSVGGVLCKGAPAAATTGTSEAILATCTVPANTLTASGSMLRVTWIGHSAATANNKIVRVRVGGIAGAIVAQTTTAAPNNQTIGTVAPVVVIRTGATTAATFGTWYYNTDATNGLGTAFGSYGVRAAAITWANAQDVVITATTPAASGDFTLDAYVVEVAQ